MGWLHSLRELLRAPSPRTTEDDKLDRVRLKKIWPLLRPHAAKLLAASALMIPATLFTLPQPYLTRFVVDDVLVNRQWDVLRWIIPVYLGLVIAGAAIGWVQRIYTFQLQQKALADLQAGVFSHLITLPKAYFDSKQTGHLMSRVASDTADIQHILSGFALSSGPSAVKTIGALGMLLYLDWRMTLAALVTLPAAGLAAALFMRRLRHSARDTYEKKASVYQELEQTLSGVAMIKLFAAEQRQARQLEDKLEESVEANVRHNILQSFTSAAMSVAFSFGIAGVVAIGAYEIYAERLTIGEFTAFGTYLMMLYASGNQLAYLLLRLQTAAVALGRVAEILNLMPEEVDASSKRRADRIQGELRFENVFFSYDGCEPAIDGVTWSCQPGEVIALVGPSGAGKTTMVSLIVQLYKPGAGRVVLDGHDAREWSLPFVRERVGFVSQDVFLMDGTVLDNLRFASPQAPLEEVERVAGLSGAADFIERLPDGYLTKVGERGVKLSAGERQRISLARTLLKDPDLLILDEPTSSLDAVTETHVRDSLENHFNNRTTFIIAHRLSTALWADRIFVMNHGKIVAQGPHEALLSESPLYKELWDKQR